MKILIIGKNSYIGNHLDEWCSNQGHEVYQLDVLTIDWENYDYSSYNTIVHVAGIVHQPNCKDESLYHQANTVLPIEIASRAKQQGVRSYVFLSTMAVFGTKKRLNKNIITSNTPTTPIGLYGKSKLAAEEGLLRLQDSCFNVVIVRPPNVYGKNCKGGYISGFVKVVRWLPVIPVAYTEVKQSILFIDNLCEFIRLAIEQKRHGVFMPQDERTVSAVDIVTTIAKVLGKNLRSSRILGIGAYLGCFVPVIQKGYGGVEYDMTLSNVDGMDYVVVPFEEAMKRTIA